MPQVCVKESRVRESFPVAVVARGISREFPSLPVCCCCPLGLRVGTKVWDVIVVRGGTGIAATVTIAVVLQHTEHRQRKVREPLKGQVKVRSSSASASSSSPTFHYG
jgi:hypothetical protein